MGADVTGVTSFDANPGFRRKVSRWIDIAGDRIRARLVTKTNSRSDPMPGAPAGRAVIHQTVDCR